MPNTLSFKIESIREFQIGEATGDPVTVFETVLVSYHNSADRLTIRGKPWPVGTKVDFREIEGTEH